MVDDSIKPKAEMLFEVSWEVCNKVGGIYTVVKSKAARMVDFYKENYFLVGPYFANKAVGSFSEQVPLDCFKEAFSNLMKEGIVCHYGKWMIEGNPNVILIDFEGFKWKINDIKKELWEHFKIDSLRAGYDYDEPVTWASAVGKLLEKTANKLKNKKIIGHFHEWLSGAGLLYLKINGKKVGTVFTTHSTVIGRTLANSNIDLYNIWDKIDVDKEVYKYVVEHKHFMEKQSAMNADVFTTVSEITSMEAEHLIGKKADVLLMNGLDIEKFPTFEEIALQHRIQRDRIREFLQYYFFPHYSFNLEETLLFFIAGRYEYHDKGLDILINALGLLNKKMKVSKSKKTIVTFIWVPANVRNIKPELLEKKTYYQDVKDALEDIEGDVKKNLLYNLISRKKISESSLFNKSFIMETKNKIKRFNKKGNPPLSTHDLYDENDAIINGLKQAGLANGKDDCVKVVYYPIYLSGADSLLNLNYYESMQGTHLGIFPSYYEPWGYTPLESGALGVCSITTDLAGFGRYIKDKPPENNPGIFILNRFGKNDNDVTNQLLGVMDEFSNLSKTDRIANKMQARKIVSETDWRIFSKAYVEAHNLAIENKFN